MQNGLYGPHERGANVLSFAAPSSPESSEIKAVPLRIHSLVRLIASRAIAAWLRFITSLSGGLVVLG